MQTWNYRPIIRMGTVRPFWYCNYLGVTWLDRRKRKDERDKWKSGIVVRQDFVTETEGILDWFQSDPDLEFSDYFRGGSDQIYLYRSELSSRGLTQDATQGKDWNWNQSSTSRRIGRLVLGSFLCCVYIITLTVLNSDTETRIISFYSSVQVCLKNYK